MQGFFAFAICFWLLLVVWFEQYKFFRRYGLSDPFTMRLNAALLFIVLFYVYPLKFLFTLVVDQVLGFSTAVSPSTGAVEEIEPGQLPLLMVIYGAGFVAVQFVFFLLYWRAYLVRDALGLDAHERSVTREEIRNFLLAVGVGLASTAIAVLGGRRGGILGRVRVPAALPAAGGTRPPHEPVQEEKLGDVAVELDALPVAVLRDRIVREVEVRMDLEALRRTRTDEAFDRGRLDNLLDG